MSFLVDLVDVNADVDLDFILNYSSIYIIYHASKDQHFSDPWHPFYYFWEKLFVFSMLNNYSQVYYSYIHRNSCPLEVSIFIASHLRFSNCLIAATYTYSNSTHTLHYTSSRNYFAILYFRTVLVLVGNRSRSP